MSLDERREQQLIALIGRVEDLENQLEELNDKQSQYVKHSLAQKVNDFLVAKGKGIFARKTLAETGAILEADLNHDNLVGFEATEHVAEASIDHGTIAGLVDDDHPQYLLIDGTRAMTGDLDVGTKNIDLDSTTTSAIGVIYKGTDRFVHDFHHPTGDTAIPSGKNVFVGLNAGNFTLGSTATITSHGSFNVALGESTLTALTTGYMNMGIGRSTLTSVTSGLGNVAVGYTSLLSITTPNYNTAVGDRAGRYINAGGANILSSSSVYIGRDTRASASGNSNEIVIGATARGQGSNTIMLGNSSVTGLHCYDTSISSPSDRRIKKNIVSMKQEVMLDFITELNPVTYKRRLPKNWDARIRLKKHKSEIGEPVEIEPIENPLVYAGLIAQDVEKAMKKCGVDYQLVPHLNNGMLSLRYTDLIPALIGAIQELALKVEALSSPEARRL